jgi:hypothetical protein
MEKVCAPSAILVFQILLKVRSKELEYNKAQQYPLYAFEIWGGTFKARGNCGVISINICEGD